jgi:hypothetical protein
MADEGQGNSPQERDEEINTPGAGNQDLTGQAREIVEASQEGPTGPTPGGG